MLVVESVFTWDIESFVDLCSECISEFVDYQLNPLVPK